MAKTKRLLLYLLGMVILSLGIVLNTKTALGVSPLVSIAFCVAQITGGSFGNLALLVYLVFFVIEAVLKGRTLRAFDFLQIPFCVVFTRCMNLFTALLPAPDALPLRIAMLALGILCTGFGSAIMVAMRLIPNPADGMVQILGVRMGRSMGFAKNLADISMVAATVAIGLIARGRLIGVGIGTVCAMLGTGRAVALCSRLFGERLRRVRDSAYLPFTDPAKEQA